jgi:hypothetical protein
VFTLATGAERRWDGPRVGPAFGPGAMHGCLSWAADGHTLALISSGAPSPDRGVRLLDTAAPGSSLLAGGRPVHGCYEHVPWASPSGQLLIITGTQPGPTIGPFNLGHSAGTLSQGRFTPNS